MFNPWLPPVFMQLGFEAHSVIALLAMRFSAEGRSREVPYLTEPA